MKQLYPFLIFMLILLACDPHEKENRHTLLKAESFLQEQPDSALFYLESIVVPEHLSKKLYDDYLLLMIQAKDKNAIAISEDTLIFRLKGQYEKKDPAKEALVNFYCGNVLFSQEDYEKALEHYLTAWELIEPYPDDNLKGLICFNMGDVYSEQLSADKAIEQYFLAESYFEKANNVVNSIICKNQIGNMYLRKKDLDNAFNNYEAGLQLAKSDNSFTDQSAISINIAMACLSIDDFERAKYYLNDALSFPINDLDKGRVFYYIARTFLLENQVDSCLINLNRALKSSDDDNLVINVYELTSGIHEERMNYKEALAYYKLHNNSVISLFDNNMHETINTLHRKFDYQKYQSENKSLTIRLQKTYIIILIFFLAVMAITLSIFYIISYNKRALKEAYHTIENLKQLSRQYDEKDQSIRAILLRNFKVQTKVAVIEGLLPEEEKKSGYKFLKKVNEVVYEGDSFNWSNYYINLNALYDGIIDKIMNDFPDLNDAEQRICYLSLADLSNLEMSLIMGYSLHTINAKRKDVRRKLGITQTKSKLDISNILNNQYKIQDYHTGKEI